MAHCVSHTTCPACRKLGRDRNGDNLAVYSDGSKYCFSCNYYERVDGLAKIKKAAPRTDKSITLPFDAEPNLPQPARAWLEQYSLTETDIKVNHILWSEHWQRIIFPYLIDGELLAWQGRSLQPDSKAKWFSQGNIHEICYIVGNTSLPRIVLTEDIISALCVAKTNLACVMPVFGSHVSTNIILRLKSFYEKIDVWLDYDMAKKSIQTSHDIRMYGRQSSAIITPKDPKEYPQDELKIWLYN